MAAHADSTEGGGGVLFYSACRLAIIVALISAASTASRGETLDDAIAAAYETNPTLEQARASLKSTDEKYVQAIAGYGPTIQVTGSVEQDSSTVDEQSIFGPVPPVRLNAQTITADLSLSQPLFTSGRVHDQLAATSAGILAGREDLRQAESQVILDVIRAYLDVWRDRATLAIDQEMLSALQAVLVETRAKVDARILTLTDLAEVQARALSERSQIADAQGTLVQSEAEFAAAVGHAPGDLEGEENLLDLPSSLDEAFAIASRENPQIASAVYNQRTSEALVKEAKSAFGGSFALRLDLDREPIEPYLPLYSRDASARIVFTQPLFTSGLTRSRVRDAEDQVERNANQVEITRRAVYQAIKQAWAQLSALTQSEEIVQQEELAEIDAFHGNNIEHDIGQRSTFDVLFAQQSLQNTKITLEQVKHDRLLAEATLMSATGRLSVRILAPHVASYDANAPLRKALARTVLPWEWLVSLVDSLSPSAAHVDNPMRSNAPVSPALR